jgi:RNA recognition motif-containing protein
LCPSSNKNPFNQEEKKMGKKLYVGNLSFNSTEDSLNAKFSEYGNVDSVKIITDRDTGRSKGFGFIEMESDDAAQEAIAQLDGQEFEGRNLRVNEAKPRENNRGGYNR